MTITINTNYIAFDGDKVARITAMDIFERVSCLQFNKRPVKIYNTASGRMVVEYAVKNMTEFYKAACRRLALETDYRGPRPVPVNPR